MSNFSGQRKRILVIGYNYFPEPTGIGKYTGEKVHWLAKNGYACSVITTYPYYPHWKVQVPYNKYRFWYKTERRVFKSGGSITIYRCPIYVPVTPSGAKRILLDFSFLISASFKLIQLLFKKRFDFVITVVPSFQFGLLGIIYKKIRGTKLIYHIQDLQIEAARDLKMIKSDWVLEQLFKLEKFIFRKVDVISTISDGMVDRTKEKADQTVYYLPNWADLSKFFPLDNKSKLKKDFGFNPEDKIVLYSGAIGEKQGLEMILYAAKELHNIKDVKFVICGSGPYKEKLIVMSAELGLENLIFSPLQPTEKFNAFLNMADIHLVIQKINASDLVMPSKLTTILAVGGIALITANAGTSLHSLIAKHKIGLLVDAENQQLFNKSLFKAVTEDNSSISQKARAYAEKQLSIENIMKRFENSIVNNKAV